jgi:acyl-CoA thioester hydrolase
MEDSAAAQPVSNTVSNPTATNGSTLRDTTAEAAADVAPIDPAPGQSGGPASVRIQRRVEWAQTDAAGHHHWSAVLHWVEQAETVLHERLGIAHRTFGREPRVHVRIDFTGRVYFRDLVEIEITVREVGTSSARYAFTVTRAGDPAADGELVAVHIDLESGRSQPWPADIRAALTGGGEQLPELVGAG